MTLEETLLEQVKALWGQITESDIGDSVIWKVLYNAVDMVEAIDYPRNNTASLVSGIGPQFSIEGSPDKVSQQLYVFKALALLEDSYEGRALLNGDVGYSWKSGPDSISTEGQAVSHRQRRLGFREQYRELLNTARLQSINSMSVSQPDLYQKDSDDILKVN